MSGNHSRYSHQNDRRYSALHLVQGAMVTDADQMEGQSITGRLTQDQGRAAIGSGVPRSGGILTYARTKGPADTALVTGLKPGRVVANGRTAELRLAANQALTAGGNGLDLFEKQADLLGGPELPKNDTPHLVYVDVWDRHVGPAEDGRQVDAAFLGAETSVRKERVAQLKFAPIPQGLNDDTLRAIVQGPVGFPRFGDFRLTKVVTQQSQVVPDPCDPCPAAISDTTLEAGNDLFRFEIHQSSFCELKWVAGASPPVQPDPASSQLVTVKWSRDNGGLEIPASARDSLIDDPAFENAVFELVDVAGEQRLGLFSPSTTRASQLLDRAALAAVSTAKLAGHIIRVWDGMATIDLNAKNLNPGAAPLTGSIVKDDTTWTLTVNVSNLTLTFVAQAPKGTAPFILPGDAWCVEVREFTTTSTQALRYDPEPVDITHDYVYIGQVIGRAIVNEARPDLRPIAFPALTDLTGEDVRWSNHHHPTVNANTVQGAIDLLLGQNKDGCQCTFLIDPKRPLFDQLNDINEELNRIGKPMSALICFPAGEWVLAKPFTFEKANHLILRGAGLGSKIYADLVEFPGPAFTFRACKSVTIEDIAVENRAMGSAGCVSAHQVNQLRLRRVSLLIEGLPNRNQYCACLSDPQVDGLFPATFEAIDCRITIGSSNTGFIIAGACRLVVTNCEFAAPLGLSGSYRSKLGPITKYTEVVKYAKVSPAVIEKSEGRYVVVQGVPKGYALDLGEIIAEERTQAAKLWEKSIKSFTPEGAIASEADFANLKQTMSAAWWLTTVAVEQSLETLDAAPDKDALILSAREDMRLLRSLAGSGSGSADFVAAAVGGAPRDTLAGRPLNVDSTRFAGMIGEASGLAFDIRPIGLAAEAKPDKPVKAAGRDEVGAALKAKTDKIGAGAAIATSISTDARMGTARMPLPSGPGSSLGTPGGPGELPPATVGVSDLGGRLTFDPRNPNDIKFTRKNPWDVYLREKPVLEIIRKERFFDDIEVRLPWLFGPGALCFGIEAALSSEVEAQVVRNRFSGVDVAIKITGSGADSNHQLIDELDNLPERTLIRDNVIVRKPRKGSTTEKEGLAYPITLIGCGNIHIEANTIQQIADATIGADYKEEIFNPKLSRYDVRYAAIGILGYTGQHVRVIGNSANLYRHCVFVEAMPRAPADMTKSPMTFAHFKGRGNYWIFQHNLITPNAAYGEMRHNWAVRIPNQATLTESVNLIRKPNHTEPPDNET